jgi:hypothetical protein
MDDVLTLTSSSVTVEVPWPASSNSALVLRGRCIASRRGHSSVGRLATSMTGRISTASKRGPGIRAAMRIASARSLAAMSEFSKAISHRSSEAGPPKVGLSSEALFNRDSPIALL